MITDFPVERGHILQFARAIRDPNPIYRVPGYASASGVRGVIAPPTFVEAGQHFDPDFAYRPEPGRPWFGSGRETTGAPPPGGPGGTSFHAETHFSYHRLIRPGDGLHTACADGEPWSRTGRRGGRLHFAQHLIEFLDPDNRPVVSARVVSVRTERVVESPDPGPRPPAEVLSWGDGDAPSGPDSVASAVGARRRQLLVDNLTRGQIMQYAGASGDLSPQHTDEVYARAVGGYPTVFAHGMLTMGMTGRLLTDWLGDGRLLRYGMRFAAQVWPGDALTAYACVRSIRRNGAESTVECELWTVANDDRLVASGYATAKTDN